MTDEPIQPELRGHITPDQIAAEVSGLLTEPARREQIRVRLAQTMPEPGAAARLTARVLERLGLEARTAVKIEVEA
jgi:hypothetical protein